MSNVANPTHNTEASARGACIAYLLELARKRRQRLAQQTQEQDEQSREQSADG